MTTLFKHIFAAFENCTSVIEEAGLEKKYPDKIYSQDAIRMSGTYQNKKFRLELILEDVKE